MSPEDYENEIAVLHLRERLRNAEVARLTSELAAARENEARLAQRLLDGDRPATYELRAIIDAARSAGGGT